MAGGQGNGLRMNEAEISRIVGGRTNWESFKAKLGAWQSPRKLQSLLPSLSGALERERPRLTLTQDAPLLSQVGFLPPIHAEQ